MEFLQTLIDILNKYGINTTFLSSATGWTNTPNP